MRRDGAYLLDILLAARRACCFVEGLTREGFLQSDLHQHAVVRLLGPLGEAAGRVSEETRSRYPEIPWQEMIGILAG